jgi:hypothetical protein
LSPSLFSFRYHIGTSPNRKWHGEVALGQLRLVRRHTVRKAEHHASLPPALPARCLEFVTACRGEPIGATVAGKSTRTPLYMVHSDQTAVPETRWRWLAPQGPCSPICRRSAWPGKVLGPRCGDFEPYPPLRPPVENFRGS